MPTFMENKAMFFLVFLFCVCVNRLGKVSGEQPVARAHDRIPQKLLLNVSVQVPGKISGSSPDSAPSGIN